MTQRRRELRRFPMPRQEILDRIQKYVQPFRITRGDGFQLKSFDPGDTLGLKMDKGEASELLQQARHVGRESAGGPGLLVQAALTGGPRSRLHVAILEASPRARTHRDLQPLLLRGGPGRARTPGDPASAEDSSVGGWQAHF